MNEQEFYGTNFSFEKRGSKFRLLCGGVNIDIDETDSFIVKKLLEKIDPIFSELHKTIYNKGYDEGYDEGHNDGLEYAHDIRGGYDEGHERR